MSAGGYQYHDLLSGDVGKLGQQQRQKGCGGHRPGHVAHGDGHGLLAAHDAAQGRLPNRVAHGADQRPFDIR